METAKRSQFDETPIGVEPNSKRVKTSLNDEKLKSFLRWSCDEKILLNPKVTVNKDGSCAQYGMVATEAVDSGEVLFEIPRSALLMPETCNIAQILTQEPEKVKSPSGWVPLLLALLHEYTSTNSRWSPYLHFVPDYKELNLPMFWPKESLEEELAGTAVPQAVERDVTNLTKEFNSIAVPFMKTHSDVFPPECLDIELYKKMVAFVMSYSFTEPVYDDDDSDDEGLFIETKSPPMMVPMADMLNHVAKNNAYLDYGKDALKMTAVRKIAKGEEVYNTYGQLANSQLLHMYGFAEAYPNNHYDTVDIPMKTVYTVVEARLGPQSKTLLQEKWAFLKSVDLVTEDGLFVVGSEGVLTEEELYHTLKVLTMDEENFIKHRQKEGWSDDEDDEDSETLTNDDIPDLPESWKQVLRWSCEACLSNYGWSLEEERSKLQSDVWERLAKWQQFAVHVRYGQLKLLHGLSELCANSR